MFPGVALAIKHFDFNHCNSNLAFIICNVFYRTVVVIFFGLVIQACTQEPNGYSLEEINTDYIAAVPYDLQRTIFMKKNSTNPGVSVAEWDQLGLKFEKDKTYRTFSSVNTDWWPEKGTWDWARMADSITPNFAQIIRDDTLVFNDYFNNTYITGDDDQDIYNYLDLRILVDSGYYEFSFRRRRMD